MTGTTAKTPLISIVDDDESVRVAMSNLIRSIGFAARSFASAEEFLTSPDLEGTSCLISDVQMPGISGLELQTRLAAQNHHAPVILITAFPDADVKESALKAGAVCFLHKPFDGQVLIRCLDQALKRHSA